MTRGRRMRAPRPVVEYYRPHAATMAAHERVVAESIDAKASEPEDPATAKHVAAILRSAVQR